MAGPVATHLLALALGVLPSDGAVSTDPAGTQGAPLGAAEPQPPKPSALRRLGGDFARTFTSEESLWILGAGGAAALLARPLDDHIQQSRFNSELHQSSTLDRLFEPGDLVGDAWLQFGAPIALLASGKLAGNSHLTGLGGDLLRAQVVSGSITTAVKLAVRRERPDATSRLSFPSGHTSGAFATATVIQRRYGWRAGVPAHVVAAWVAASRLNENKHYLSDVTFGAAVGIAAGRAVTVGRGSKQVTITPQVVPGGGAGLQVRLDVGP